MTPSRSTQTVGRVVRAALPQEEETLAVGRDVESAHRRQRVERGQPAAFHRVEVQEPEVLRGPQTSHVNKPGAVRQEPLGYQHTERAVARPDRVLPR